MTWKCPECGTENADVKECNCGYAFYKVLGIRPDTAPENIRKTYKYLLELWEKESASSDPIAKKKAVERLKKINAAYEVFKKSTPPLTEAEKRKYPVKIVLAVTGGLIVVVLLAFLVIPSKEKPKEQSVTQAAPAESTLKQDSGQNNSVGSTNQTPGAQTQVSAPSTQPANDFPLNAGTDRTEENAIEMVKKSHALDPIVDVDAIMKKWTDEKSGKLQFIGWKAKKFDENTSLVSYSASDGLSTTGFYFEVDFNSNTVSNIQDHPELQQKYNIKYNR